MITLPEIAKLLDHSTLQPFLTENDIIKGCDIALQYQTATVCARPGDMPLVVKRLSGSSVLPCTVIGFPHGAHHMDVKCVEAVRALDDGCRELDMVLNIG
ncbi:MAG: deoxyribose-phosphate aldolase, partial [Clostridia bacterium]|nr:deoxyribose-phosphate aldolase [Clostridia bacterium]